MQQQQWTTSYKITKPLHFVVVSQYAVKLLFVVVSNVVFRAEPAWAGAENSEEVATDETRRHFSVSVVQNGVL